MDDKLNLYLQTGLSKKNTIIYTGFLAIILILAMFTYSFHVFLIGVTAYIVSILVEYLFAKIRKKELGHSYILTPIVFTLLLPPTLPLWIVGVGAFFGTFFAKGLFGGGNKYIFPPSVAGVLFITISFPAFLNSTWLDPGTLDIVTKTPINYLGDFASSGFTFIDLLLGQTPGPLGVTFRLPIILIGLILFILKVIDYKVTLSFIASFLIFTLVVNGLAPETFKEPLYSLFTGSILFVAFFIASDSNIAPLSILGKISFGIGLGFFTVIIRHFSAYPEGVIFAIIIMSAVSPLLDDIFKPKSKEVIWWESILKQLDLLLF